jgi:endonuclease YncB( thermonuclease family)
MNTFRLVTVAIASSLSFPVSADFTGRVVGISDGDTVKILVEQTEKKVRLTGIDAPEKRQPFGQASKQSLSDLIYNKTVRVEERGEDRYGRTLGRILLDGRDINLQQVQQGFAWHFKKYAHTQPSGEAAIYDRAEQQARSSRKGLWQDPRSVAPWEFRHRDRR